MLFENENQFDFTNDMDINIIGIFNNNGMDNSNLNLFKPEEALMLGNAFKDLYKPYKNYRPPVLHPITEREKVMMQIYMYDFVINDLNLYLDLHPTNNEAFVLFKKYCLEYKKYLNMYEEKYGPLVLTDITDSFKWSKDPWPWNDTRRDMYV